MPTKTSETLPSSCGSLPSFPLALAFSSVWTKILALVVVYCWFPLQYMHFATVNDPDVWWHMRTGEWIFQHHAIPHFDPFSATGVGKPWVAYSWLFDEIIYWFVARWDLLGIVIYEVLMCVAITAALLHLVRSVSRGFWPAVLITLLGSMAMSRINSPRPGMITTLLFIVALDLLLCAQRTGKHARLCALPFLFFIWANIHVQFVYGLFILLLFCTEALLNGLFRYVSRPGEHPLPIMMSLGILAASIVATLLNPNGFGVYRVLWDYIKQPKLAKLVLETQPMNFMMWINWLVLALTLCAAGALWKVRPVRPLFALMLVWAAFSAFRVERDVWVLVTISCVVLAAPSTMPKSESEPLTREHRYICAAAVLLVMVLGLQFVAPTNRELLARLARVLPMGSVAYIHEHHPVGPIFNDFNWGGFLIYALPDMPVSIDGRTNVHGAQEIEASSNTWDMGPGWENNPNFAKANIIVGEPNQVLTKALSHDPRYNVVFNDGVSVLILKNQ